MIDPQDIEEYIEGYREALAQCTVLAAQLLKMALHDPEEEAL